MSETKMQPIMVIPPKIMSDDNIKRLRDNGICVVIAEDPSKLRFVDPLPSVSSRTQIDEAAIQLSRVLLNNQWGNYTTSSLIGRGEFTKIFVDLLIKGTSLDSQGTLQEQEQRIIDAARRNELDRIGREEARAERAARKEALQKKGSANAK